MGSRIEWGATPMSSRGARRALDKAREFISELDRALDQAALRAAEIGANDTLERIDAAKAAAKRGATCLAKLRSTLSSPQHDRPPSDHGRNLIN